MAVYQKFKKKAGLANGGVSKIKRKAGLTNGGLSKMKRPASLATVFSKMKSKPRKRPFFKNEK